MEWEHLGTRKGDFMKNHLLYEAMVDNFKSVFNREHPIYLTVREEDTFTHYIDSKSAEELTMFLSEQINNDPLFMNGMLETGKQKYAELLDFCGSLDDVQNLGNKELAELVNEYFRLYKEPYPYFMITVFAGVLEKEESDKAKEAIDIMAKLRYIGRDSYNKTHELSNPLFEEIAKRLNLTIEEVKFLKPKEILDFLIRFAESRNLKKLIKNRQHCYFIHREGKFKLRENELYEIRKEPINQNADELKGQGTFPASYKGKVRLVNSVDDLDKLQKGEIIVTRMTTPNLVTDAIRKAGAIITDEGGITCHAAIVSREFKIPCLMGTKFATNILKNGDFVELDAEKGIVRKIITKKQ